MENKLFILFFILIAISLSFCLYISITVLIKRIKKSKSNEGIPPAEEIDVSLKNVNEFIRKEFLFEFQKWIWSAPTSINMSDPDRSSTFINDLKNPEILQKKMKSIVSLIISKMSVYLISEFSMVYNLDQNEDALYDYVTRHVMFYIRRIDMEITSMFETDKSTKTTDLLKSYVVAIEAEIYKINDISIVEVPEEEISNDGGRK